MLTEKIAQIRKDAEAALALAKDEGILKAWENTYLSRKGELNSILRTLGTLSDEEKRIVGPLGNETKTVLYLALQKRREEVENSLIDTDVERLDVTLPGTPASFGHLHPITRIEQEIQDIFIPLGFGLADGPELESEFYNFNALNVPADHPARDMQDTFWLKGKWGKDRFVLRTHTSSVQIRYMEKHKPPFRIIVPGRFYRNESTDASHEHTAHQFECLMVGEDVSVANFKSVAKSFFSAFFKKDIDVRLRPSYFPFTEPSFEFDINCLLCNGAGCPACKGSGWLEIGGAGMVNQKVFEAVGYPRGKYQGFAWGFGLSRLAMMKYGISDVRTFMSGDLRFIRQF
ncbi:MAG: phenylalanine--tRNA ligase subunit alpha [Candidatus Moraniibacteriota bacterium]